MSDVPLPEPSLEIGGKLLPYERRHFHTPGMAAKLGYTEGLQQYWNAGAAHAHAAAVSAALLESMASERHRAFLLAERVRVLEEALQSIEHDCQYFGPSELGRQARAALKRGD